MAKLIVNPTSPSRREVALSRSLVSIGRDPSNDVVLPDAMVSRRHAVIEYRGSQYYLRDCNSSNGSLINGDRVSERGLRDGDLVAIGTARLLFRDDLVAEDAAGKVIHHPSSPRQQCPSCQEDYRKGDVFCRSCGSALAAVPASRTICTACGTAVPLPARFCTACGTRLASAGEAAERVEAEAVGGGRRAAEGGASSVEDLVSEPPAAAGEPPAAAPEAVELAAPAPAAASRADPAPAVPAAPAIPVTVPSMPVPAWAAAPAAAAPADGRQPQADAATSKAPALPAGAAQRLFAFLVDAVIVGGGQVVLSLPALLYWMGADLARDPADVSFLPVFLSVAAAVLAVAFAAVYHVYFVGVKGATPGKRMLGIAVQGLDGRLPVGTGRAALRLVGYGVSGLLFGIGFLMIAFGGGGLHDQIAGTRVVRRKGA